MKKLAFGCISVVVLIALVSTCLVVLSGTASIAAVAEGARRGTGLPETWLRQGYYDSCSVLGDDWCNDESRLAEYVTGDLGEDVYVPIVPPPMPNYGSTAFDDSELRRWLLLRGMTTATTKGVAAIIAVTPVSGTLPLSSYPNLFYFPSFHSALIACYGKYAEEVRNRDSLRDFYAWAIQTDTLVLDWGWSGNTLKVTGAHQEKQIYLCVVYLAPVWQEYIKLYGDGSVSVNLPSNTMMNYIPATGGLAEGIATGIVDHCRREMHEALVVSFLARLLKNVFAVVGGNTPDAYRYSYGQMEMVCSISAVGRVVRMLPTPTPTPTATPTPTTTPTPTPRHRATSLGRGGYPTPTPSPAGAGGK